jgi:hypothetical protein
MVFHWLIRGITVLYAVSTAFMSPEVAGAILIGMMLMGASLWTIYKDMQTPVEELEDEPPGNSLN